MKRLMSLILALICIVSLSACGDNNIKGKEFSLGEHYYVVRSEKMDDNEHVLAAMNLISDAIASAYGETPSLSDDWYRKSAGLVTYEYEILIGSTNRMQSEARMRELKIDDYGYYVESENVIVICGGSPEATKKAAEKFKEDLLSFEAPILVEGTSYTYRAEYSYSAATLNGTPIEDYTIAIPSSSQYDSAVKISNALAVYNGHVVPIKEYSELEADDKSVICLGASDVGGKADKTLGEHLFKITSRKSGNGTIIAIDNAYTGTLDACADSFSDRLTVSSDGDAVTLSIAEGEDILAYTFEGSIPRWELERETTEEFYDGITYLEQLYYDENGLPYRAYVLFVDPAKASLYMGSTNDGYDYSLDGINKMNVADQMKAAMANGFNTIAGVNGDFFAISEDYRPRGLTIKEGQVVGENTSRSWVGFTYDGKMVIGTASEYSQYEGKLRTAVGGRQIVLRNGTISNLELGTDFSETPHPRTLAGYKEDGTMIFAVIDGRQKSISNGAPLARCALFMRSLGAVTAINLDGGGSSCMILRRGENNFETMNSPSDGWLRKVYNSILVIPNQ